MDVSTSIKELHEEFSAVPFSHSAVATDLAEIEKHLVAELPVSMRCKEIISEYYGNSSEIFYFNQSSFVIVSSFADPLDPSYSQNSSL